MTIVERASRGRRCHRGTGVSRLQPQGVGATFYDLVIARTFLSASESIGCLDEDRPGPLSRVPARFHLDQYAPAAERQGGPARSAHGPRLLGLLLHQLHARPAGAAPDRRPVREGTGGGHRSPFGEIHLGEGPREHTPCRAALRRGPPGGRRLGARHLGTVRSARLADAGPGGRRGLTAWNEPPRG